MVIKVKNIPEYDGTAPASALDFLKDDLYRDDDISYDDCPSLPANSNKDEHKETSAEDDSASVESSPIKKRSGRKSKATRVRSSDKAKTSLYISPETLHDLRVFCADAGVRMTDFVEAAVKDRLKAERKKKAKEE